MRPSSFTVYRFLVVALCSLALAVTYGLADEARNAYRRGVELRDGGNPVEAVERFSRAATLEPGNGRYRRALAMAKQNAADVLTGRAESAGLPTRRYESLLEALIYVPDHSRATQLMANFREQEARVRSQVAMALEKHRSGEFADCRKLSRSYDAWKNFVPSLNGLATAAEVEQLVRDGRRRLAEDDDPQGALQKIERARAIDPNWPPAQLLLSDVIARLETHTLDSLKEVESALNVRASLQVISSARDLVERYPVSDEFRTQIQASAIRVMNRLGSALDLLGVDHDGVEARFLRSRMATEMQRSGLSFFIPDSTDLERTILVRVRLDTESFGAGCDAERFETQVLDAFVATLPEWIALDPVGPSSLVSAIVRCARKEAGSLDIQTHPSVRRTGEKLVPNPNYVRLEQQLEKASREMEHAARQRGGRPDDDEEAGDASALAAWRGATEKITSLMKTTPRQVSEPVSSSYEYETYRQIRSLSIEGTMTLVDLERDRSMGPLAFRAESKSEDRGTRGVSSDDMEGHGNHTPALSPWEEIQEDGYRRAGEQATLAGIALIRKLEAAKACESAKTGDFAGALAHGTAYAVLEDGEGTANDAQHIGIPEIEDLLSYPRGILGHLKAFRFLCQHDLTGRPQDPDR